MIGTWWRTAIAALLILSLFAVLVWIWTPPFFRHTNLPWHPYPPPGWYVNPFSPGHPDDLVDAARANAVKRDLLNDGRIELDALRTGDPARLTDAASGMALQRIRAVVAENDARGIYEEETIHLGAVEIGRLPDPNDRSITWCVEEHGSGAVSYRSRADGSLVSSTPSSGFANRYWLVPVHGHYLIADVGQVTPGTGG